MCFLVGIRCSGLDMTCCGRMDDSDWVWRSDSVLDSAGHSSLRLCSHSAYPSFVSLQRSCNAHGLRMVL
jgi:hypothetical protein